MYNGAFPPPPQGMPLRGPCTWLRCYTQATLRPLPRQAILGRATDLWLDEVRQQPDAFLLAYAMNGEPLTPEHGYPVRLTADGKYGYKWCKWLTEIELVDHDVKGHYEGNRGWSDAATRGQPVQ